MLAAVRDWVVAAPVSFATGLLVGFWIGGRYDVRKKRDL